MLAQPSLAARLLSPLLALHQLCLFWQVEGSGFNPSYFMSADSSPTPVSVNTVYTEDPLTLLPGAGKGGAAIMFASQGQARGAAFRQAIAVRAKSSAWSWLPCMWKCRGWVAKGRNGTEVACS